MYIENPVKDLFRFVKACLANLIARLTPTMYVALTHETGRGEKQEDDHQVANYFIQCFQDYHEQLGLNAQEFNAYLKGKAVLEYGPGDILGIALLMYAHGARFVHCIDRFPLAKISEKNIRIYRAILDTLTGDERERANHVFNIPSEPESGFNPNLVKYSVAKEGLVKQNGEYDLIVSRAVLEHVNSLEKTIRDIENALRMGGTSIHQVDLRSHGLDRHIPLDFLTWPDLAYRLMYSHKGFPNRYRINKYREVVDKSGLRLKSIVPTEELSPEQIDLIRPRLARPFRNLSPEVLGLLGFWMLLERPEEQNTDGTVPSPPEPDPGPESETASLGPYPEVPDEEKIFS